jgi:hypothetical protein
VVGRGGHHRQPAAPWLIKKGADLPLLLIFAGVIGGLVAFGLLGIFIGPVVLAVTYTLMGSWMDEEPMPAAVSQVEAGALNLEDAASTCFRRLPMPCPSGARPCCRPCSAP